MVDDGGVAYDSHDGPDPGQDVSARTDPELENSAGIRFGPCLLQPWPVEQGDGFIVADDRLIDGLLEHGALVAEMEIDRLDRHTGSGSDLFQRGAVVASGDEKSAAP